MYFFNVIIIRFNNFNYYSILFFINIRKKFVYSKINSEVSFFHFFSFYFFFNNYLIGDFKINRVSFSYDFGVTTKFRKEYFLIVRGKIRMVGRFFYIK